MARSVVKVLSGVVSTSSNLVKQAYKNVGGALTPTGILTLPGAAAARVRAMFKAMFKGMSKGQ
jgi:hypothetical protein